MLVVRTKQVVEEFSVGVEGSNTLLDGDELMHLGVSHHVSVVHLLVEKDERLICRVGIEPRIIR